MPGIQLAGDSYIPLAAKIQELFPGKLWVGLLEQWSGEYPSGPETSAAIIECTDDAV